MVMVKTIPSHSTGKPLANPQRLVLVVLVIVVETSQAEHEDENNDEDDAPQRVRRIYTSTLLLADWQGSSVHHLTTLPHPILPVTSPDTHRTLTVAPLARGQRCYGEATACIRRGSPVAPGTAWPVLVAAAATCSCLPPAVLTQQ